MVDPRKKQFDKWWTAWEPTHEKKYTKAGCAAYGFKAAWEHQQLKIYELEKMLNFYKKEVLGNDEIGEDK